MEEVKVLLGVDLSAYSEVAVTVDRPDDVDALIKVIQGIDDDDLLYTVDWDSSGAKRIVQVLDDQNRSLASDIPLEPVPYDGGNALSDWLKGTSKGGLPALLNAAELANLIDPIENVTYVGAVKAPDGRAVEIGFVARRGATREELVVACVDALATEGWSLDVAALGGAA